MPIESSRNGQKHLRTSLFIPLGDRPQTQCLSRLAAVHKPSVSRLAAVREPSIYPAWRLSVSPVIVPLGGCPSCKRNT